MPVEYMTVDQVIDRLRISRAEVFKLLWSGEIKNYKSGKKFRIKKVDVDVYVASTA